MKNILLCLILIFGIKTMNAQYVTIPDIYFRAKLKYLYPACFNASEQMDTTCSAIVNATSLNVGYSTIQSIEGIRYFKKLTTFACNDNKLTSLPLLPPLIQTLYCELNALTSISSLPPNLKTLYCFYNQLTSLPPLPATLETIECDNNKLTSIPTLPSGFRSLACESNKLTALPQLPPNLFNLWCRYNQISSLPKLPDELLYLYCDDNGLTSLPLLPKKLRELNCNLNHLTSLPALPDSLKMLYCKNNPLSCLPFLPPAVQLQVKGTNVSCLPNTVSTVDTFLSVCSSASNICPVNPFVAGKIYLDTNSNNVWDSTEQLLSQQIIRVLPSNWMGASNVDGFYIVKLDTAVNNTWSAINNFRYATITPSSYALSSIHNLGLQNNNYNFGVHLMPNIKDLEVRLASTPARPGFLTLVAVTVDNVGTVNQSNITIKLKKPNGFNIVSSSITPKAIVNDTLIWDSISVNSLERQTISIFYQVPMDAVLDSSAYYEAWANGVLGDSTPLDNYTRWVEIIRGSFDPNDKLVNKPTLLPTYNAAKDRLLYTIRFQNTGTDTAFTVIVRDTILNNLDVTSLHVVNASHKYQLIVREKDIVEVVFPNIQLPAKIQNETKSHGFVQLEFKPKEGLPLNAVIKNKAAIFFDYNAPVITNIATTRVQITTGIVSNKKLAFKLFPNPTSVMITVELPYDGNGQWQLTDISGKMIQQNNIENNTRSFTIDVNNVVNGTYLLSLEINNIVSTSKVVIVR